MKKTNTTLDREPMNSQAIRERQNFDFILKETAAAKIPIWKSIWFYGPVGIAMVTMVVSAVRMNPKNKNYDENTTLSQITITNTENNSANTITVERSNEALTETKSDSNNENVAPIALNPQKEIPSSTITPIIKTDTVKADPTFLIAEQNSKEPKEDLGKIVESVVAKKAAKTMPDIAGVFNGRISVSQMCSSGIIHCNNDYQVISYDIQYDNGAGSTVDRVSGNRIPSYICSSLKRYNVGSPVFITKIIAMNKNGERKQLLSMSIEPTF